MTLSAWAVFLIAIGYTIWDGIRRTRGQKGMEGFFAAGRSIPWWAAGLSVMATQLSAITIIGGVGMGYENGLEWVQFYFALPFAMVLLCIFAIPAYRQHPILTAYEYLERRFGPVTRTLTSATFLLSRCLAFGVVLYAPAVVFSAMSGVSIEWTVIATGIVTTAYTVIGGVGGVVWTDVKQMVVIVLGIVSCLGFVIWQVLQEIPVSGVLPALGAAGRLNAVEVINPAWSLVPGAANSFWSDKYNLWTGLFGTLFLFLSYFGCDQVQVQSLLSSKSVDASRRALLMSAFTKVPLQLLVLFLGALLCLAMSLRQEPILFDPSQRALVQSDTQRRELAGLEAEHAALSLRRRQALIELANGAENPAAIREWRSSLQRATEVRQQARTVAFAAQAEDAKAAGRTFKPPADTNFVFPHFLFHELPKPLLGLMIAAIFAAAISSAAGALSSLTSATMVDFHRRWFVRVPDDRRDLRTSRIVMACWGGMATAAALWLGGGPLLERVNEIGSWFYGSILGVFVIALAMPRANGRAASAGLIGGLAAVFIVDATIEVAFLWYNLIGCAGACAIGFAVLCCERRR